MTNPRDPVQAALEAQGVETADLHLARHLCALGGIEEAGVRALLALLSARIRQGNVCLPLREPPAELGLDPEAALQRLEAAGLVTPPDAAEPRPLVRDGDRLYLARYHAWERQIIEAVTRRLEMPDREIDEAAACEGLARLFPKPAAPVDWQRVAAVLALLRPLCVISGGPGTGKTWTVARILALLRAQPGGESLRIGLAAPTGKAAGRLAESIAAADPELAGDLPEPVTLHRLLGMRPGRVRAWFGAERPLPLDLLVVDEVSMVDLPMLARLFAALRPETRLVLLGDRHQLASVEAGRVMADLCGPGGGRFSGALADRVRDLSGDAVPADDGLPRMADHLVELTESRRFDPQRGIGRLARAVNAGDADAALAALAGEAEVDLRSNDRATLDALLRTHLLPAVQAARQAAEPAEALRIMGEVRVLCALREGPQGVCQLNRRMARLLGAEGQVFYPGQPIMVTANDYALGLFNGDVGLVLPDADGRLRVWFPDPGRPESVRGLLAARLPPYETVFAMTIHKSQGSEFDRVVLVLPDADTPLLSRELIYTGITRARESVLLCAGEGVLRAGIARQVERSSGLYERLWG